MDKEKKDRKKKKVYEKPAYEVEEIFEKMGACNQSSGSCGAPIS